MPKATKVDPDKVAAEVKNMQQELKALEEALVQLVDAMITEEKPGFRQIKKLKTLRKKALDNEGVFEKVPAKHEIDAKIGKTEKPLVRKRP